MDPNETTRLIRDSINRGDFQAASEHADNYRKWLSIGGFTSALDGWPEVDWLLAVRKFGIARANLLFDRIN